MKISQDRAKEAAAKLTAKAREKAEKLHKEYQQVVIGLYNEQFPKEVHDFAKKYPQHICFANCIQLSGPGMTRDHSYVDLDRKEVISNVAGYAQANLHLTAKTSTLVVKAREAWLDAKKDYGLLKNETQQAILNLGTTKRVQESFPIAVPFLGLQTPQYAVPALNLAPLKAKLEKLQKA